MSARIAIVMPAYRAETIIHNAVGSVLAQTVADWQIVIVADDGVDYEAALRERGIVDARIRFLATPTRKSGASAARNVALEAIDTPFAALLDADDRFHPEKLARCLAALETHAIVSTAIDVVDTDFRHLRYVGKGVDRPLTAGRHKFVNLSMDSMIAWDRRRTDARCDATLPNMNDLDLLIRLYAHAPDGSFHIGTPLHDYVKVPTSLSNAPTVTERMVASKTTMMARLRDGHYGVSEEAVAGLTKFLMISIAAERAWREVSATTPGALFEDHIEPRLRDA